MCTDNSVQYNPIYKHISFVEICDISEVIKLEISVLMSGFVR